MYRHIVSSVVTALVLCALCSTAFGLGEPLSMSGGSQKIFFNAASNDFSPNAGPEPTDIAPTATTKTFPQISAKYTFVRDLQGFASQSDTVSLSAKQTMSIVINNTADLGSDVSIGLSSSTTSGQTGTSVPVGFHFGTPAYNLLAGINSGQIGTASASGNAIGNALLNPGSQSQGITIEGLMLFNKQKCYSIPADNLNDLTSAKTSSGADFSNVPTVDSLSTDTAGTPAGQEERLVLSGLFARKVSAFPIDGSTYAVMLAGDPPTEAAYIEKVVLQIKKGQGTDIPKEITNVVSEDFGIAPSDAKQINDIATSALKLQPNDIANATQAIIDRIKFTNSITVYEACLYAKFGKDPSNYTKCVQQIEHDFGGVDGKDSANLDTMAKSVFSAVTTEQDTWTVPIKVITIAVAGYATQYDMETYLSSQNSANLVRLTPETSHDVGIYGRLSYGAINFSNSTSSSSTGSGSGSSSGSGTTSTTVQGQILDPSVGVHYLIDNSSATTSIGVEAGVTGRFLLGDILQSNNSTFRSNLLTTNKKEFWSPEATIYLHVSSSSTFYLRYTNMPSAHGLTGFGGPQLTFGADISTSIFK